MRKLVILLRLITIILFVIAFIMLNYKCGLETWVLELALLLSIITTLIDGKSKN